MKRDLAYNEVRDFKYWCNENEIIPKLIRQKAHHFFVPPILDVGAGLGDIAYNAFPTKEAFCIDTNKIDEDAFPLSQYHLREQIDFFDFNPPKQINTLFIAHTLQFIDEDLDKLNAKIRQIDAEYVILVLNDNNDFMGEIVQWAQNNCTDVNPEVRIVGFPEGYSLKSRIPFTSKLKCPDFDTLSEQIYYLVATNPQSSSHHLKAYLSDALERPEFSFQQSIEIYQKNGR